MEIILFGLKLRDRERKRRSLMDNLEEGDFVDIGYIVLGFVWCMGSGCDHWNRRSWSIGYLERLTAKRVASRK